MPKMVQVRHVPDRLHGLLRKRAEQAHLSLSDFILQALEREAARPSREELFAGLRRLPPVATRKAIVGAIREQRDRR